MRRSALFVTVTAVVILAGVLAGGVATAASVTQLVPNHRQARVIVDDIQIPVPGQTPVSAYVVRPDGSVRPHSAAGILYLHWFEPGQVSQNRTEFLAEATGLAAKGVVSVLPQLTFPWSGDPVGDVGDRTAVAGQLEAVRRAYATLLDQSGVDPGRTAVVGHDYGAMYGSILAQREPRIRAEVFMAGDATWANWFDTYWLDLPEDQKAAYRALFAGLDPVDNVSRLGSHVLFQWGDRDPFIPAETRAAFAAVDPSATATLYRPSDHFLTQAAKDDRFAFLAAQLGL